MNDAPGRRTGPILFVADIHLDPGLQAPTAAFIAFTRGPARAAESVFILGDLFEVWVGDDDDATCWQPVLSALADLTGHGTAVWFIPGNRDFLVGPDFAARTGVHLLDDPTLVELQGVPTLLCHGDALCTDDTDHQAFREQVQSRTWRREFLQRPLAERRAIAEQMRARSRKSVHGKAATIMDVNPDAVVAAVRGHGAERLIHGHTHRPGHHLHEVDGHSVERWVLGDWYEQGSMLELDHGRIQPRRLD